MWVEVPIRVNTNKFVSVYCQRLMSVMWVYCSIIALISKQFSMTSRSENEACIHAISNMKDDSFYKV